MHFSKYNIVFLFLFIKKKPAECEALISKLRSCNHSELLEELKQIDAWTFGKCELFHWIDVLDLSDTILEEAAAKSADNPWELACDLPQNGEVRRVFKFFKNTKKSTQSIDFRKILLVDRFFSFCLRSINGCLLTL